MVTGRRVMKVAGAVIGVVVLRLVAGVWIAAAVLAGLAVIGLVAGWAAIERQAFPRRPRASVAVAPRGRDVALARALAVVAAAYLAECERDQRQEMGR